MQYDVVKLKFSGPLHIARGRPGAETGDDMLRSDTLKSAIFSAALEAGIPVDQGQTEDHCPFLDAFCLSSAFPFIGEEYFFPKPKTGVHNIQGKTPEDNTYKQQKTVRFVGKSYFEQLLAGNSTLTIPQNHLLYNAANQEKPSIKRFVSDHLHALQAPYLMEEELTMRVSIPRTFEPGADATPYYTSRLHFHETAGLYFLIEFKDENQRSVVNQALEILGENGVGTDRTSGNGAFAPEWGTITLDLPATNTHRITLSLFCPSQVEVDFFANESSETSAYSLIKRGGWLAGAPDVYARSLRKRAVYMLEEGAVLPGSEPGLYMGLLRNLRPEMGEEIGWSPHPVWRDGRAFTLPFKLSNRV